MTKEELIELRKYLLELTEDEQIERDLYLRKVALGEIQGRTTGLASFDKPWLQFFSEEAITSKIEHVSIYDNLVAVAKKHPNKIALNYFGKKYTYADLVKKVDIVAKALLEYGVKPGDVVTFSLPNIPENIFGLYAANKIGAISNFIDLRMVGEKLLHAIESTDSHLVFTTDIFVKNLEEIYGQLDGVKVVVGSPATSLPFLVKQLYSLKNNYRYNEEFKSWNEFESVGLHSSLESDYVRSLADPVCILHTSGTTNTPKGVVLTNSNFLYMVDQVKNGGLVYGEDDVFLSQVPPFLAYNVLSATNNPLSMGLQIKLLPDYQPEKFGRNILKYRPNHVICGPADCTNLLETEIPRRADMSFLVSLISGSDKLGEEKKVEIREKLHNHGCDLEVLEGYGMTEVGAAAVMNIPNRVVPDSVGIPLRHVNIGIFDQEGNELGYNEVGEICMAGPTVMKEYLNNEEETQNALRIHEDGSLWLHTGDYGYMSPEGNLFLKGRLKRVIVRYEGFKVSPYDLEKVINEVSGVGQSCVVGIPDEEHGFGSKAVAAIVRSDDCYESDEHLIDSIALACERELSERYQPQGYYILDEMPLTSVGKVDYRKIEEIVTRDKGKCLRKQ